MIKKLAYKELVYFEDVFENLEELLDTVYTFSSNSVSDWEPWYAYGGDGHQYGEVKYLNRGAARDESDLAARQKAEWLIETLVAGMKKAALEYAKIHDIHEVFVRYAVKALEHDRAHMGISYYFPHREMGPHIDWNENNSEIEYTIVVYLNDEYEGGELHFVEPELEDLTIKPKAGSIVVFPSHMPYKHESLEIRQGRKMLITHHWKGGPAVKRIRHLVALLRGEL